MTIEPHTDSRSDRILDVAMELANENGFDAVRLRDLAQRAEVALGTVYRRFGSKEDILAAVLERMVSQFHEAVTLAPVPGANPVERLGAFFTLATQALAEQPKLASALFRSVASGEPAVADRVLRYRATMTEILLIVWNGEVSSVRPPEGRLQLVRMLQNLWFAEMVGWTGGLQDADAVIEEIQSAIAWLCDHEEAR